MRTLLGFHLLTSLCGIIVCGNRFNYVTVTGKMTKSVERVPLFLITDNGIERVEEAEKTARKRSYDLEEEIRRLPTYNPSFRRSTREVHERGTAIRDAAERELMMLKRTLVERETGPAANQHRKRELPRTGVVEMAIVADSSVYKRFLEQNENQTTALNALRLYYTMYAKLMDQWYGSLQSDDVIVRVQPVAILVSTSPQSSPFTERIKGTNPRTQTNDELDAGIGLRAFRSWAKANMNDFVVQYDHAMLFTDYAMYRGAGFPTSGLSFVGKICRLDKGWSVSIMSEEGGFNGVYTSVHELTHNLGADHDGEIDQTCQANQNMVMAPTNYFDAPVAKNYFLFSKCTESSLRKMFKKAQVQCLFETKQAPPVSRDDFQPPGEVIDIDQQCEDTIGRGSRACTSAKHRRQRCYRLWCKNPTTKKCTTLGHTNAVYGTPCGNEKWCRLGECIPRLQ